MACAFIHTNGRVSFRSNPGKRRWVLVMLGAEDETSGGVRIGFDPVVAVKTKLLPWAAMPDSELAALRTFKHNTVKGSDETFIWLSPNGTATTVRFADGKIGVTDIGPNANAVDVLLELA